MALIGIFIVSKNKSSTIQSWKKVLLVLAYLIATSLIVYGHGKGLFLLPFFFIVGWVFATSFKKTKIVFSTLTIYVIVTSLQSFLAWKNLYRCPEYADFEIMLKSYSIDPASAIYDTSSFFERIYGSAIRTNEYLYRIIFNSQYQVNYLAPQKLSILAKVTNLLISINIFSIFFGLLIALPIFYAKDFFKKKYISVNFLLLTLFFLIVISSLFNLTKTFYDAGYLYTLLAIILIFFIAENRLIYFNRKVIRGGLIYFSIICCISQFILISNNLQPFRQGFTGPGISMGMYEDQEIHHKISSAVQACNIDLVNGKNIITDDLTYGYFRKNRGPIAYTYLSFVDPRPDAFKDIFIRLKPDGMVLSCELMTADLKSKATHIGEVCCLSKTSLESIAIGK